MAGERGALVSIQQYKDSRGWWPTASTYIAHVQAESRTAVAAGLALDVTWQVRSDSSVDLCDSSGAAVGSWLVDCKTQHTAHDDVVIPAEFTQSPALLVEAV